MADSGGIRIADTVTLESHSLLLADGTPLGGGSPRWDLSGKSFIYTHYVPGAGLEVFRVWPDSSREVRLTRTGWTCEFPKWFRHGAEIVFHVNNHSGPDPDYPDWWVIDGNGSTPRPFLNWNLQIPLGVSFDFSPDEKAVVVSRISNCGTYFALWIIRFDENRILEERQITGLPEQMP